MAFRLTLSLTGNTRPLLLYHAPSRAAQRALSGEHINPHPGLQQKRHANGYGGGPQTPGQVSPQPGQPEEPDKDPSENKNTQGWAWGPTLHKMFESAATTTVSLVVLG